MSFSIIIDCITSFIKKFGGKNIALVVLTVLCLTMIYKQFFNEPTVPNLSIQEITKAIEKPLEAIKGRMNDIETLLNEQNQLLKERGDNRDEKYNDLLDKYSKSIDYWMCTDNVEGSRIVYPCKNGEEQTRFRLLHVRQITDRTDNGI